MTSSKSTKRAWLSSVVALLLCLAMLIGTTFAWFTDSASTGINTIQSGNLDLEVYYKVGGEWALIDEATDLFANVNGDPILWEPGVTATETFMVKNAGNLALKYVFYLNYANATETADGKTLADVLTCGIEGYASDATTGLEGIVTYNYLLPGESIELPLYIKWVPTDHDNDYNVEGGLSIDLGVKVFATQYTHEYDSIDNQYDKDAPLPDLWDGKTATDPVKSDEDGKYHITSAAEFYRFVSGDFAIPAGNVVVLDCDVDLAGATVKGYCNGVFDSSFDGQGHTVSNFTVATTYFDGEHYCGLFPYLNAGCYIKNLTVKDAVAAAPQGVGMVGLITGAAYNNTTVENCHAVNCTAIGNKKVGTVAGFTNGTVKDCSATDCEVYCGVSADTLSNGKIQAGEVVGYIDAAGTLTNCTHENVTVTYNAIAVYSGDATKLAKALKSENKRIKVTLTEDVSMNISLLNPQIGGSGEYRLGGTGTEQIDIDLNGHKLTLDTGYMSALGANNTGAVINVKNGSINSTQASAPWNVYDLIFANCTWNFEDVTFDKAVAIYTGTTATMENVTINDSNDVYGLWITADAKTVTLDNVTINCPNGRGIAIKDQYREAAAQNITLNISDSKITSARKAAVLVSNVAGATVNATNVDISAVAADTTNLVWRDNGHSESGVSYLTASITVSGCTFIDEP